jgi:hypothetical protein
MSDPREKKLLDFARQRRGFSEYAHALRHGKWRKNTRRPAQKVVRQAERVALSAPAYEALKDIGFDLGSIARPRIAKWTASSLGDWITKQKAGREARAERNARRKSRP